jgi:cell division protein FtsB
MNKKRVKNGVVQGEYRKECEKISREVEEMKRKIKQMSSGGTNAYAEQNIHHIQPL